MSISRNLFVLCLLTPAAVAAADPKQVTILHVNDTHSHLAAWGPKDDALDGTLGGLGRAATIVAGEKAADPSALFVHAGDLVHGDPFFNEYLGVPELLLLQAIGLDVLVPGNHEFQFGPEFLTGVLAAASSEGFAVSIVGTNLDLSGYPILGLWISSTVIKDAGGVKVGFFGLSIDDLLSRPEPVVIDENFAAVATQAVAQLRADGADVVVCLAHIGLGRSRDLAAQVSGIDVIVQGHDHDALPQPELITDSLGGTTILVSAGPYYRWVGRLRLSVDGGAVTVADYALIGIDPSIPPLPPIQATIDALKAGIVARFGDLYHEVIAWADQDIADEWDPAHAKRDTAIGNLFTDAYRAWTGTDIAVEVLGFLDEGLPAGPIVGADLFRSMDYGLPVLDSATGRYFVAPARLVTFAMPGAQLFGVLDFVIKEGGDLFPQVSGMRLTYDSSLPKDVPWIDASTVHIGGARLDPDRLYTITANEVLLIGLGDLGIAVQDVQILPDSVQTAVRTFAEERGTLGPRTSGRLRDVAALPRRGEVNVPPPPRETVLERVGGMRMERRAFEP